MEQDIIEYLNNQIKENCDAMAKIAEYADMIRDDKHLRVVLDYPGFIELFYSEFSHHAWCKGGSLSEVMCKGWLMPYLNKFKHNAKDNNVQEAIACFYLENAVEDIIRGRRDHGLAIQIWGSDNSYEWAIVPDLLLAQALGVISIEKAKEILNNL